MASGSIEDKDILERALLNFLEVLGNNKLKLFAAMIIGGVLGVSFSFTKTKLYRSQATLIPEINSSSMGSLSSIASMAGIDAGGSSDPDAIRPDVYPMIMKSTSALIYLLNQPVKSDSGKSYSNLLAYFNRGLEAKVNPNFLKLSTEDSIYKYKKQELIVISSLRAAITSEADKKSGIITISVEMSDPRVAAIVLANSIKYLKSYVTDYRYGKKHSQKGFYTTQLTGAKNRMIKARNTLQSFRDRNRNIFLNTAKIEEDKLAEEYSIALGIYNSLLRQTETLNITEKQQKPVFEILESPIVPSSKSSPNRIFYGLGGSFLTLFLVACLLLILDARKQKTA